MATKYYKDHRLETNKGTKVQTTLVYRDKKLIYTITSKVDGNSVLKAKEKIDKYGKN